MKLEDIQARYSQLCLLLGDLTVKQKGLQNQIEMVFKELEMLDEQAKQLQGTQHEDEDR